MKQRTHQDSSEKLEGVRREFETWRAHRRKGERIPETLWEAATRLVSGCGLSRVSGALSLDYYKLKKRSERIGRNSAAGSDADVLFAELTEPVAPGEAVCVVELEKGNGTRMRIALTQRAVVDWERLTDTFLKA